MSQQLELQNGQVVHCLRCQRPCRPGTPDPKARAIRRATTGFCPDCAITHFLLSIEPIRDTIDGTPARGDIVPAREGQGPEILLAAHVRQGWAPLLAHTQVNPDEIDWIEVVSNWRMPWPKGQEPKVGVDF